MEFGRIVVLNGTPRSGKSSIAAHIQRTAPGTWMNLGVDGFKKMTPERYQPGIGLRPGGERPDLEPLICRLYAAMYDSIAAHSRLGIDVVVDVGHHDCYSRPLGILRDCARRLTGLPALLVGVHCPAPEVMRRMQKTWNAEPEPDGSIPQRILRWVEAVHDPGIYDVEVDTSTMDTAECTAAIFGRWGDVPLAFGRLAALD